MKPRPQEHSAEVIPEIIHRLTILMCPPRKLNDRQPYDCERSLDTLTCLNVFNGDLEKGSDAAAADHLCSQHTRISDHDRQLVWPVFGVLLPQVQRWLLVFFRLNSCLFRPAGRSNTQDKTVGEYFFFKRKTLKNQRLHAKTGRVLKAGCREEYEDVAGITQ
jgi:hypothetical protein